MAVIILEAGSPSNPRVFNTLHVTPNCHPRTTVPPLFRNATSNISNTPFLIGPCFPPLDWGDGNLSGGLTICLATSAPIRLDRTPRQAPSALSKLPRSRLSSFQGKLANRLSEILHVGLPQGAERVPSQSMRQIPLFTLLQPPSHSQGPAAANGAKNPGSWLASVPLTWCAPSLLELPSRLPRALVPLSEAPPVGMEKGARLRSPPALRENLHNASQDDFGYLLDPPSVSLVPYHIFTFTRAVSYLPYCVNELYIILNSVICFMILSEDHQFPNLRHDLLQLVSVPCVHVAAAERNPP
ncbi:hypothetical protein I7I51_07291 [Histoplasma capsulatum]|uniref:Uncharacterized protein n=1 Tax=Ajellomyces capsulatus TaxID=5037 RepID=A0A8A1MNW8_AJECA|nr:hypothetical protein I7I51_07291 [Histoplasma capsulatum]